MLEKNTIITLDNDKKYTVLRTMDYNSKQYALITDFTTENNVVEVSKDDIGLSVSLVSDSKTEEIIINKFLKDSLLDLQKYNNDRNTEVSE